MIFDDLKTLFRRQILADRILMTFLGIGGVIGLTTPVLFPNQNREAKLLEHLYGLLSLSALTVSAKLRSQDEKIYKSINDARVRSLKQQMQHRLTFDSIIKDVEARREVAAYVATLPVYEQMRWIQQYNLQGLIEFETTTTPRPSPSSTPQGIPNPAVIELAEDEIESVVNPGVEAILKQLQQSYPQYVRLDADWIDELCASSANQNMSDRRNHHFYLSGETQSGKSTLAGVIINKIAALSPHPTMIIGSDPKDGVTNWLCKFSKLFPGMGQLEQWITFAQKVVSDRKTEISNGKPNLGEIFLLQDEVDTVFGRGKGFPGQVDKEVAIALQALWNYIIKFTAALKMHGVFMGQSPLSEETGFSRPSLKNICFLALGNTSDYILSNPKDFINVNKNTLEVLRLACEGFAKSGQRYALVIPTTGNPFVAGIPKFGV